MVKKSEKEKQNRVTVKLKLRKNEKAHDFAFDWGFIQEAQSQGISFGSLAFYVYHELRFNEVKGKSKEGYSYAGYKWYAEGLEGATEQNIRDAFKRLEKAGLVIHACCDRRIFRNKTRIWVSIARLSGKVTTKKRIEAIKEQLELVKVLERGRPNQCMLVGLGEGSKGEFEIVENPDYWASEKKEIEEAGAIDPEMEKQKNKAGRSVPEVDDKLGEVSQVSGTIGPAYLCDLPSESYRVNELPNIKGDSNESCVCNEDSSRKENLKESEDLVEDKSLEETSLNGNLAGVAEAEVVAEGAKEVKVPPADNVESSPSEEHSLEANESSSKAGLDAETVNGKGENKKKSRKGNKRVVFSPPSIEEIQAYCDERQNGLDAEEFWAYYESRGWYVGKNKMKSWKAAVITWEKRNREWGKGNQRNQNTGIVRGDAMYEPRDGEDLTYQRVFEFWRKAIGASVPQTVSQVEACKALLADVGEEWVERMIVARAMSVKTPFTTKEVKGIQGFIELADRRSLMMSYYNEHWEKWKEQQRREQLGKKPWEV